MNTESRMRMKSRNRKSGRKPIFFSSFYLDVTRLKLQLTREIYNGIITLESKYKKEVKKWQI